MSKFIVEHLSDRVAAGAAAGSAAFAGATWVTDLNEVLQVGATVVAILAGLSATWYHVLKVQQIKKGVDTVKDKVEEVAEKLDSSGQPTRPLGDLRDPGKDRHRN